MFKLPRPAPLRKKLRELKDHTSGVAMVEFAFSAPIVLALGLLGAETANFTITHMQISQLAMQVADNASRVGEEDVLAARNVFESDINESLVGGEKLGETFDIYGQGRVIISSLQVNDDGGQWIAWQRCRGALNVDSAYGAEGTGSTGNTFPGMGESGREIISANGTAVMFVEVYYDYEPITPIEFFGDTRITYEAAFNIRDDRNLEGLQNTGSEPVARCNVYSADRPT